MKYRNKIDIISIEKIQVDAGSLWELKGNLLVLEDEDQYVSCKLSDNFIKLQ